jgi:hypothetical protein
LKPDISLATKTGHFNLPKTVPSGPQGAPENSPALYRLLRNPFCGRIGGRTTTGIQPRRGDDNLAQRFSAGKSGKDHSSPGGTAQFRNRIFSAGNRDLRVNKSRQGPELRDGAEAFQSCLRHSGVFLRVLIPPVNWRAIFRGHSGTNVFQLFGYQRRDLRSTFSLRSCLPYLRFYFPRSTVLALAWLSKRS